MDYFALDCLFCYSYIWTERLLRRYEIEYMTSRARGQRLTVESGLIQGFYLEAALGERIGLTDEEWAVIGRFLPAERGRGCRPAQDNRRYRRWVELAYSRRCSKRWPNWSSGTEAPT